MGIRVAVAGATGYAGGELMRLLAFHPYVDVAVATGHSSAGSTLAGAHPHLRSFAAMPVSASSAATLAGVDLVFLALPHGESAAVADAVAAVAGNVKIVDLAADHRTSWVYGIPELPGRKSQIAAGDRVAAAGCYATAVILGLAPLIAGGLAAPADVVVTAASGTSGAGRSPRRHLLGSEVMGAMSAYRVGAHQHVPEIKHATGATSLTMVPMMAPMPRGILASIAVKPASGSPGSADGPADGPAGSCAEDHADAARRALIEAYADEPFVHVLPPGEQPCTSATLGANVCLLQVAADRDSGRLIVTSALDNLVKGAAGQAVQCANLMLGLPPEAGLPIDGLAP